MPLARLENLKLNYLQLSPTPVNQELVTNKPGNLIMVHGLATSLAFWYPLAHNCTHSHRVTLFDLRGHGRSSMPKTGYTPSQMAEDLKQLMDYLELETADLVGHSFGGSVILNFALRYPQRVRTLAFVDTRIKLLQPEQKPTNWVHWDKLQPSLEEAGIYLDEEHPEAGYQILVEMARWRLEPHHGKSPFPKLFSLLFPQGGSKHAAKRWLKLVETTTAGQDFQAPSTLHLAQLQQLEKPTFAIYGERSPTLPTAEALKQIWFHAHFELVPKAGHFFPLSQPDFLVAKLQNFYHHISLIPTPVN